MSYPENESVRVKALPQHDNREVKEEPAVITEEGDAPFDKCASDMDVKETTLPILAQFPALDSTDNKPALYEIDDEVEFLSLPIKVLQSMFDSVLCGSCNACAVKVKYEVSEMCPHKFIVFCGSCGELLFY